MARLIYLVVAVSLLPSRYRLTGTSIGCRLVGIMEALEPLALRQADGKMQER